MKRATTELEKRLERRLARWRVQAEAYRLAQRECEPSEEEWTLNKENADMLERLSAEIREDLAAARAISRSQYEPKNDLGRLQRLMDEKGWSYADLVRKVWADDPPVRP